DAQSQSSTTLSNGVSCNSRNGIRISRQPPETKKYVVPTTKLPKEVGLPSILRHLQLRPLSERGAKSVSKKSSVFDTCPQRTQMTRSEGGYPTKTLAEFKTSAKMMCKRHLILRLVSRKQTKFPPTVEETTRFSVNFGSDSLRGLEHLTSVERCRERATRLRDTNDAICQSQKEQLLNQSLDRVHKNDSQTGDFLDFALDQSMLAQVYREKCRGAIKYSLRVAQEDARVAKAILLEVEGCT
ncbi:hypothetical protein THAOC_32575, partial [Thalassiosira oceanica]